jgi:predicted short-subunit dehydrogenase-like oxidoreductase (DUF2520 family)
VNSRPRVQIFGAGRAGLAVARRARDQGVLAGAWNRSPLEGARAELARNLPIVVSADPGDAADSGADLWLVAVADDAVPEIAAELAEALAKGAPRPRAAAHCAGARSAGDLAPLRRAGVPAGSWHPAMTFRGTDSDAAALADAWVAIEGDDAALDVLRSFSDALGLASHVVAEERKPHYHTALVIAANGRVALDAAAEQLLVDVGLDTASARRVLAPLVARVEENLRAAGPCGALTGPVVRGDAATVRAQLEALADRPLIRRLYGALTAALLPLVSRGERGTGHHAIADLVGTKSGTESC